MSVVRSHVEEGILRCFSLQILAEDEVSDDEEPDEPEEERVVEALIQHVVPVVWLHACQEEIMAKCENLGG